MSQNTSKQRPYTVVVLGLAILLVFIIVAVKMAPKSEPSPPATKQPESPYKKLGLPEPRSQEEIAARLKEIEKEEQVKEEVNKEFYKTKAGKIWRANPMWSKEDCERLAGGEIWIGMKFEMLKYLNGKPDVANPSNYGSGVQWQWCWHGQSPSCYYDHNNDGKIDAYN